MLSKKKTGDNGVGNAQDRLEAYGVIVGYVWPGLAGF